MVPGVQYGDTHHGTGYSTGIPTMVQEGYPPWYRRDTHLGTHLGIYHLGTHLVYTTLRYTRLYTP